MPENVLILGEIGRAVFEDEGRLFVLHVDSDQPTACRPGDVALLMDSGVEILGFDRVPNVQHLQNELRQDHARHRALSFVLSGLDPDLSAPTRTLCIEAAEELCADAAVRDFVQHRLLSRPLPASADISAGSDYAMLSESHAIRGVYEEVAGSQEAVQAVQAGWKTVSERYFAFEQAELTAERTLADRGVFASLARAVRHANRNDLSAAVITYGVDPDLRRQFPRISFLLADLRGALLDSTMGPNPDESLVEEHDEEVEFGDDIDPILRMLSQISDENSVAPERRSALEIKQKVDKQIDAVAEAINLGELDRAEVYLRDLVAFHVRHDRREHIAMTLSSLATVALNANRFDLAERLLNYAEYVNPVDPVLDSQRGQLLLRTGHVHDALTAFNQAISRFPNNLYALYGQAEALKELGKLVDALATYDEMIGRFPDEVVAQNGRAKVLKEMGRLLDALAAYDETIERFPDDVFAWNGRAEVLKEMGRLPDALAAYDHTIERFPDNVVTRSGRAEVLKEMGKLPLALDAYEETIDRFPDEVVAQNGRAEVLKEMGRLPDALAAYDETIERFPDDVFAWNGRAEVLKEMGRLPDALAAYDETIERFPDDVVTRSGRAEVLKEMGRLPLALAAYEETIGHFPDDVVARNGRAEVLKEMGKLRDALAAYDETTKRFPDNVVARNGRATVLILIDRITEARESLPQTLPTTKQDWVGYHILAMSYLRQGELELAIERLTHGVENVPWTAIRAYFERALALALIRKREFEAAAKVLEEEEASIVEAARNQVSLLLLAHSHAEMDRRAEALDNLMQITGAASPDLRMLKSALMTQYGLGSARLPAKQPWLQADIEDREFRLVLAAA